MPLFLVPADVADAPPVPVDKPVLLFGRHSGCDVIITCSRRVSRRHCCVAQIHDDLVVRDLGSMNGVRVNGRRIDRQTRLRVGDTLSVGDVAFKLTTGNFKPARGKVTIGPSLEALAEAKKQRDVKPSGFSSRRAAPQKRNGPPQPSVPTAARESSEEIVLRPPDPLADQPAAGDQTTRAADDADSGEVLRDIAFLDEEDDPGDSPIELSEDDLLD